ncbi:hypothetical protein L873DRAFT_1726169, partial [Choiromyces venosus 120613-1]
LLILNGHSSHVNLKFSEFCDSNNIICFCLPPHSTHILEPLGICLFGPLQKYYGKMIENYHITTNIEINHCNFLPLYKYARTQAYTIENVKSAIHKTWIVPFLPHMILPKQTRTQLSKHSTVLGHHFPLDKTPYTKCQLCQQTNQALSFVKSTTEGEICSQILRFSHTAEYNLTSTDIATTEMQRLRVEIKITKDIKKDRRILSRARVITGAEAMEAMCEADAKKKTTTQAAFPTQSHHPTQAKRDKFTTAHTLYDLCYPIHSSCLF